MANQAVETQIPALETTCTYCKSEETGWQKNKFILIKDSKDEEEQKAKYLLNGQLNQHEQDPPFIEVEDPIPELRTKPIIWL